MQVSKLIKMKFKLIRNYNLTFRKRNIFFHPFSWTLTKQHMKAVGSTVVPTPPLIFDNYIYGIFRGTRRLDDYL